MKDVTVYGVDWCEDTKATRNHLDSLGVQSQYVDVERDGEALAWVEGHSLGEQKTPTVDIGGQILSAPDERELEGVLRGNGLMA